MQMFVTVVNFLNSVSEENAFMVVDLCFNDFKNIRAFIIYIVLKYKLILIANRKWYTRVFFQKENVRFILLVSANEEAHTVW